MGIAPIRSGSSFRRAVHCLLGAWLALGCSGSRSPVSTDDPADPDPRRTADRLYPYIVPEAYLQYGEAVPGMAHPLGHGMYVVLVFDLDGRVGNARAAELRRLGLSPAEAHARALANLERLAAAKAIAMTRFDGPSGKPFIVVDGSWAAAASLLLPRLREVAAAALGTREICASIPHRDAMLLFGKGDRAYRDEMRALVREKESDGRKPLTFELYELDERGVQPFAEP